MIDEDTQLITKDIPQVLTYLFENYGKVPSKEVKQKETELRSMTFQPADPMILLYNPIEKLRTMAESAEIAYTAEQLLDIGLTIICNTRDFETALGAWEILPATDKTWTKFKEHFSKAQKQLKAIRGPTMQQAGYHHTNMLATQLKTNLERRDNKLFSLLQSVAEATSVPPSIAPSEISTIMPTQQQANATTTTDPVQLKMLKILQQMQQSMFATTNTQNTDTGGGTCTIRCPPKKTQENATYPRKKTDIYCWTHGDSNHSLAACNRKAPGHQDAATFKNCMGGSNAYCPKSP